MSATARLALANIVWIADRSWSTSATARHSVNFLFVAFDSARPRRLCQENWQSRQPKNDISLRVDIARGRDETVYYVGIGIGGARGKGLLTMQARKTLVVA